MKLRPRFSKVLNINEKEIDRLIIDKVSCQNKNLVVEDNGSLKIVKFPDHKQHLWTPQMEITLEFLEEGIMVRGSVGPSNRVWLVFSFLYFAFGLAFLASLFYGLSQYVLHHPYKLTLLISAICFISLAALHLVSYIGQYKSRNEIEVLSQCFINDKNDKIE